MSLRQLFLTQQKKEGFISVSALKKLVTEESVKQCLRRRSHSAGTLSAIASKAPKLFSILVLIQRETIIFGLIADGISDSIFPILEYGGVPERVPFKSRKVFFETQYDFPPVFETRFHIDISQKTKLPFLEQSFVNNGTFGLIYKLRVADGHLAGIESSTFVALKKIVKRDHEKWEILMREADTLRTRQHPNIVPLLASFTQNTTESEHDVKSLNLLFPYAELDLERWMNLPKTPQWLRSRTPDRHRQRNYLYNAIYSLVSALAFLHREIGGMITSHHDLKPKNVLVIGETLKICDFGRSHLMPSEEGSQTEGQSGLGTFTYNPPEYWNDDGTRASRSHGRAFDVWTMACIMLELATLVVYGWESKPVKEFRDERLSSQNGSRKFKDRSLQESSDDSFHNNMDIVQQWMSRMEEDDESPRLIQVLGIAEGMLEITPEERLFSWEAELDLYELLNPDLSRDMRLEKMAECVQPPGQKKGVKRRTPVHRASVQGDRDRLAKLLKEGWPADEEDSIGNTPYQLADQKKHLAVMELLESVVENQAAAFSGSMVGPGAREEILGDQEAMLRQDAHGRTRLHWAAFESDKDAVAFILKKKSAQREVWVSDEFGKTPLHLASEAASVQIVSLILEASGKPEELVMTKDCSGKIPLHWAALGGNTEAAQRLLSARPNSHEMVVDEDDNGKNSLHFAIKKDHFEVEKVLKAV